VIQTGTIAAVAVAFARFLGVLVPAVSGAPLLSAGPISISSVQLVALAVIAVLTASNSTGLKAGTRTQNVFTGAKLAALLALAGAGLFVGAAKTAVSTPGVVDPGNASAGTLSGFALIAAFAAALVGPLFSQSAWNNVTFAGEEVRDPARNLPFALLTGCLIVTILYVATNVSYLRALPFDAIQHAPEDRVGTAAAGALFGKAGPPLAAAAIMVSTFGCVNGLILSGARVSFAMARDGLFFRGLERLNTARVPAAALAVQGVWAGLLVLSGSYSQLLRYVISVDLVLYVLLVAAVVVLRRRRPEWPRPFRAPAYPWLQLLYAAAGIAVIALLLVENPRGTWPGYFMLATGVPVFFVWSRRS